MHITLGLVNNIILLAHVKTCDLAYKVLSIKVVVEEKTLEEL